MQIRTWLAGVLLTIAFVTDAPSIHGNNRETQAAGAPRSRPRSAPTSPTAVNQANSASRAGTGTIQGAVHRVRRLPPMPVGPSGHAATPSASGTRRLPTRTPG